MFLMKREFEYFSEDSWPLLKKGNQRYHHFKCFQRNQITELISHFELMVSFLYFIHSSTFPTFFLRTAASYPRLSLLDFVFDFYLLLCSYFLRLCFQQIVYELMIFRVIRQENFLAKYSSFLQNFSFLDILSPEMSQETIFINFLTKYFKKFSFSANHLQKELKFLKYKFWINFCSVLVVEQDININLNQMIKLLTKNLNWKFCLNNRLSRIYDITFQIKDVTMIRGMTTNKPYFQIQKEKIEIPIDDLIFAMNVNKQDGESFIQFLDKDLNFYHPTTPLKVVCQEPFFVKKRGNVYCVLNNEPLVKLNELEQFDLTQCSKVIEQICIDSIQDLPQNQKQLISGASLHNLIINNLLRHGMGFKIEKIRIKQILKVVDREIALFETQIKQLQYGIKRKANRRLRNYTNFLFLQYAVIHYYIYQHLSWDIMEPITVIFANVDLFVGYLFFVMRGRQWSLGEMHGSYIDQKKYSNLKANGINVQKYDQLLKIREYLLLRFSLLSKNPYELMEALKKPIKMLDTR